MFNLIIRFGFVLPLAIPTFAVPDDSTKSVPIEQEHSQTGRRNSEEQSRQPIGRWNEFPDDRRTRKTLPQGNVPFEDLEALGYLGSTSEPAINKGIVLYDAVRAHKGVNLYTSGHGPEAFLMDMEGRVVHQWKYPFERAFPDYPGTPMSRGKDYWRRVHLFEDGSLLAIFDNLGIIKLDKDSNLIWANACGSHHDLEVQDDNDIYVLTRVGHLVPRIHPDSPIFEDYISILDSSGVEKKRVSMLKCMENSDYWDLWENYPDKKRDIFHTNSIEVLDGRVSSVRPEFQKGNILTSMCNISVIAVVDIEKERIVWALKGPFKQQHDPKILENGNLMLYDNQGRDESSAIYEYCPSDWTVEWLFRGTEESPFFSFTCGSSQRLPNGNTLICESDMGRSFEITHDGQIVWEFYNPNQAGENGEFIATLFDLLRMPADFPLWWITEDFEETPTPAN